jgi:predicted HD phosphohydrolase
MTRTPSTGTTSFTRMDESTAEDWKVIGRAVARSNQRAADRVLGLLGSLAEIQDGFATDQLVHCLQTATRAERAGADEQVVVASLLHDVGKAVTVHNHAAISAEILRPYVDDEVYEMIRIHQDFQGKHYYEHLGGRADAREAYRDEVSADVFALTVRFADEWDQVSFDPHYDTLPLEHFEPAVRRVFDRPRVRLGR